MGNNYKMCDILETAGRRVRETDQNLDLRGKYLVYSGPSILRPPMGRRKCGLILQVVLK